MNARTHIALAVAGLVVGAPIAVLFQALRPFPAEVWVDDGTAPERTHFGLLRVRRTQGGLMSTGFGAFEFMHGQWGMHRGPPDGWNLGVTRISHVGRAYRECITPELREFEAPRWRRLVPGSVDESGRDLDVPDGER